MSLCGDLWRAAGLRSALQRHKHKALASRTLAGRENLAAAPLLGVKMELEAWCSRCTILGALEHPIGQGRRLGGGEGGLSRTVTLDRRGLSARLFYLGT